MKRTKANRFMAKQKHFERRDVSRNLARRKERVGILYTITPAEVDAVLEAEREGKGNGR